MSTTKNKPTEFEQSNFGIHWSGSDMEYRYRNGRVSQDEWEAFCAVHPSTCDAYDAEFPPVARIVVQIDEVYRAHHGKPIAFPSAAVRNVARAHEIVAGEGVELS